MRSHNVEDRLHVEIQTPKQNSVNLEADLEKFAEKYLAVVNAGYAACITDNPMGLLSFQATEIIPELDLPVRPGQLMIHLNTFHTKAALDEILDAAAEMGCRQLLVVSGDGNERLTRLAPEAVGSTALTVTSVELLAYIHSAYPGAFECGVAFNPYEPQTHELEKMRKKLEAGAGFICTQPIIGRDERLEALRPFGVPVIIDAWMSKKLHLLSECVGYTIPEDTPYDPMANLAALRSNYPEWGLYLALLGYKTQFPLLNDFMRQPFSVADSLK
ncbi:MAG: methylenetetrahydrofolate reductase [Kiritimatiellia bacterium]|nr:methylenetetrahydrofolate reductase [Lentisphaerota bacterium]